MGYTPNNPYIPGDPYSYDLKWMVENLGKLKDSIAYLENAYTTPTVVDTAAEMTDRNKIYVYVGSEIGYLLNHWYYYDFDTNLWTDGGAYGALDIDVALSTTSNNAVRNSTITANINDLRANKQNVLTFDSAPTAGSSNPVTSDGIKSALDTLDAAKQNVLTFDSTPTAGSSNPVTSDGIKAAIDAVEIVGVENGWNYRIMNGVYEAWRTISGNAVPSYTLITGIYVMLSSNNQLPRALTSYDIVASGRSGTNFSWMGSISKSSTFFNATLYTSNPNTQDFEFDVRITANI